MSYLNYAYPQNNYQSSIPVTSKRKQKSQSLNLAASIEPDCLWKGYPHYGYGSNPNGYSSEEVYEMVGGNIYEGFLSGEYYNSCALRLSVALIHCGHEIPYIKDLQTNYNFKDKKRYIISAYHMKLYLEVILGNVHEFVNDVIEVEKLQNRLGNNEISILANAYHIGIVKKDY
ncbi:MAG: hypothetical protein KDE33_27620, partial [Bacteroidetes bacterium]|nr:hypothetical protein [Bacteroidota bacterium]